MGSTMSEKLTPEAVEAMFTRADDAYVFARWGRPIAPVVFGVDDATLDIVKGAIEAVTKLAGIEINETDPEFGSNLMFFFFSDWNELLEVRDLAELVPDLGPLVDRLKEADANQYRLFRFDKTGAIKACFVFLRMDAELSDLPADTLALAQVVQACLLWSQNAFRNKSPLANTSSGGASVLREDIADLIRAAYHPVMPVCARDKSHALRLFARL